MAINPIGIWSGGIKPKKPIQPGLPAQPAQPARLQPTQAPLGPAMFTNGLIPNTPTVRASGLTPGAAWSSNPAERVKQIQTLGAQTGRETQASWDRMNPFKPVSGIGYTRPSKGTVGPGGSMFDSNLGASNNNPGSVNDGLWAQGYDVNDPNAAYNLYDNAMKHGEFRPGGKFAGYQGKSDSGALLNAANSYYSKQARNMDKDNNFLRSVPGQLLAMGLTGGIGAVAGIPAMAATSALLGGASGGVKGALMGGLGSALGGKFLPMLPQYAQRAAQAGAFGNALIPRNRG